MPTRDHARLETTARTYGVLLLSR